MPRNVQFKGKWIEITRFINFVENKKFVDWRAGVASLKPCNIYYTKTGVDGSNATQMHKLLQNCLNSGFN